MHQILKINALSVAEYLNAQIDAGAQAVMIFDSWGGVLADGAFQQFSLQYTSLVLSQLKTHAEGRQIPRIVFTKGGGLWLEEMRQLDCEVLGLDWTMNLGKARALVGGEDLLRDQAGVAEGVVTVAGAFGGGVGEGAGDGGVEHHAIGGVVEGVVVAVGLVLGAEAAVEGP